MWSIDAVYNGLKQVGCKVIWALKDDWYSKIDKGIMKDPKFWIRPFVPQIEILAHESVKAGLNHCGWGGILEYV
jgi:hypothetical protein